MSLYNTMNGMNAKLALVMAPFLPVPFEDFPRYRDIFLGADDCPEKAKGDIYVYTRMGAGNAECWGSENDPCDCPACTAIEIIQHPTCTYHYDDSFDCTFRTFVITVDNASRDDFEKIKAGQIRDASNQYFDKLRKIYDGRDKILDMVDEIQGVSV